MDKNLIHHEIDEFVISNSFECFPSECSGKISNPKKYLKIITQNVRSIYKNFDSFVILLSSLSLECDIIILTECWLDKDKTLPLLNNYNLYYSTAYFNQNDGVVVYTRSNLPCVVSEPVFPEASCLLVKIGDHTAILACYRSPSRNSDKFINSLEYTLQSISHIPNGIIMGDINIDIKLDNVDKMSSDYLNLTALYGYLPANVFLTREGKCIDHALLKSKRPSLSFVIQSAITDHLPVLLCLSLDFEHKQLQSHFIKINYDIVIKSLMSNKKLTEILVMTDANHASFTLLDVLTNAIELGSVHRPIPCRQRIDKPWITPGLLRCIRHRDNMHNKVRKYPNNLILVKSYKRYRNFCNSLLKKLKLAFQRSELEIAAGNTKQTWKIIKKIANIASNKSPPIELLKSEVDPVKAVNKVNSYFASVGKTLAEKISNKVDITQISCNIKTQTHSRSFVLLDVDQDEVERTILGLKSDSATGWDGVSSRLLKLAKGNSWDQAREFAEQGLHNVIAWLGKNLLTLNFSKTKYLAFSILKHKTPSLKIRAHTLYYALCQSVLGYCISVWGGACKKNLIIVERAQCSVLKVLKFKHFRYPTTSLYNECELLSVRKLFILNTI
ncbi:putative tick transposon, partial [Operophtera brumata]